MGRILISLLVLFPAVASAGATSESTSDCERARAEGKTCTMTLDEGELLNGGYIEGTTTCPPVRREPLIDVRRDFIPQIVASVEDLP